MPISDRVYTLYTWPDSSRMTYHDTCYGTRYILERSPRAVPSLTPRANIYQVRNKNADTWLLPQALS